MPLLETGRARYYNFNESMKHKTYQKLGLEKILADAELSAHRLRNLVTSERLAGWLAGWGEGGVIFYDLFFITDPGELGST